MSRCDNPRFCRGANLALRGALRSTHVSRLKSTDERERPPRRGAWRENRDAPACLGGSTRAHPAARPSQSGPPPATTAPPRSPRRGTKTAEDARRRDRATRTGTRRPASRASSRAFYASRPSAPRGRWRRGGRRAGCDRGWCTSPPATGYDAWRSTGPTRSWAPRPGRCWCATARNSAVWSTANARAAFWRGVKTRTRGIGARSRTADSASAPSSASTTRAR